MSEAVWSQKDKRNCNDFNVRVEQLFLGYNQAQKKYATNMYEPIVKVTKNVNGELVVDLFNDLEGVELHYRFDSSFPDEFYPKYKSLLTIPKDLCLLRIVGYKYGKMAGTTMTILEMFLHQRTELKN